MEYQRIEFTTPLIKFIESCPFLPPGSQVAPMAFSPNMVFDGNALAYAGTGTPQINPSVTRGMAITKQANFIFYIRRPTNDEFFLLEVADFLYNFEAWVEFENFFGNPPRFGDKNYKERIWADNGMYWEETPEAGITDYMIQMHIDYQIKFESEDDL